MLHLIYIGREGDRERAAVFYYEREGGREGALLIVKVENVSLNTHL